MDECITAERVRHPKESQRFQLTVRSLLLATAYCVIVLGVVSRIDPGDVEKAVPGPVLWYLVVFLTPLSAWLIGYVAHRCLGGSGLLGGMVSGSLLPPVTYAVCTAFHDAGMESWQYPGFMLLLTVLTIFECTLLASVLTSLFWAIGRWTPRAKRSHPWMSDFLAAFVIGNCLLSILYWGIQVRDLLTRPPVVPL